MPENKWPDQPELTVLLNLLGGAQGQLKDVDNFKVFARQKEDESVVNVTITFTLKDGSKVPRDAG